MRSFPEYALTTVSSVSDSASGADSESYSLEVSAYPGCDDTLARAPSLKVPDGIADDADGADARATFPFAQLARHPPPAQYFGTLSHRHAGHVAQRTPECRGIRIVENLPGEEELRIRTEVNCVY